MKKKTVDRVMVYAVLIQPVLIIFQHILISVLGMSEDMSTLFRIALTALPMALAIVLGIRRNARLFVIPYLVLIALCLISSIFYTGNADYVKREAIEFTLPVVLSGALCLICVGDIKLIEDCLYRISWCAFGLVLIYLLNMMRGVFFFEKYDMSMSYAMLLPAMALYSHKKIWALLASFSLIIVILVIGSRGAAVIFFLYVVYDILFNNPKFVLPFFVLIGVLFASLPFFLGYLSDLGLNSRTLLLLLSGEGAKISGRDELYLIIINQLKDHSLFGLGLWGDRQFLDGYYCHNFFLEVCAHFGMFAGPILLVFFIYLIVRAYFSSDRWHKTVLIKYFCAGLLPLMASNSYLISDAFGVFCGILVVYYQNNHGHRKKVLKLKRYDTPAHM